MLQNQTQQCSRCLYTSDHPLGITFNQKGLCSGCQVHEEKDNLDWKQREELLKKILKPYKSKQRNYDCVIPVTGGNDSHYMVHLAKNILGIWGLGTINFTGSRLSICVRFIRTLVIINTLPILALRSSQLSLTLTKYANLEIARIVLVNFNSKTC